MKFAETGLTAQEIKDKVNKLYISSTIHDGKIFKMIYNI